MTYRPSSIVLVAAALAGLLLTLPLHEARRGPETVAATSAVEPSFRITVRRNHVRVAGHSPSLAHEARIRAVTAHAFAGLEPDFELQPLGLVPHWWEDATGALVAAVARTVSPSASLSPEALHLSALVDAESADAAELHALQHKLPSSVEMHLELLPVRRIPSRAACARRIAGFVHGPVNFEESGITMRRSALPVLDRVIALADACRNATISITGHTDSSGNEALNRELSLARARAVAAHLESRGIAGERMRLHGAGSSEPIAANATRYGRSLNRRIAIEFSYAPGTAGDSLPVP